MSSISICWLSLFWRLMKKKKAKKITKSYTVHSGMWLPQTWGKVRKERQPSFAWWCVPITMASLCGGLGSLFLKYLNIVRFKLSFELPAKVIYPKYSKHWPYTVASTTDYGCSKMLNQGLNQSWVFSFTFQAYTLPHTLNCICVSLFKFQIWILKQF